MTSLQRIYVPATADATAGASITDAVVATTSATAREALIAAGWVLRDPMVRPMTDDLMDILRFLRPLW